jgi:hypothetical protein
MPIGASVGVTLQRLSSAEAGRHRQPFLPATRITCVVVGNELLSGESATIRPRAMVSTQ